ncbi:hypothetical protein K474DRAFT_1754672 [Panus rudis PR-1116 ss-1]|nr:hypothetical protein K474DRAFT_1754672 [Panus rudis PR-1116 ss-1]
MSKSTLAMPLAAQVTAQVAMTNVVTNSGGGGYRPKGRPQEAEMEDTSDSEDENDPENAIQVSRSLAQQKLAALADLNRRHNSDRVPGPDAARAPTRTATTTTTTTAMASNMTMTRPDLHTVQTAPIPLNHPYNLPAPAPSTTPRTTRRQMLSTELSESLRRNLLWERQVSKINMTTRRAGLGIGVLTQHMAVDTTNATAKGNTGGGASVNLYRGRRESTFAGVAREQSWTDDYHYAGW